MLLLTSILLACLQVAVAPTAGWCDDVLKIAAGAPNNWDSGLPDVGQRAGIFKRYGLIFEILYTSLGTSAATGGVFGAFAKGAPVRILLAGTTGTGDLF